MSTEIENQIVSMEFDNSRFEKNVRQSMQTIADLNESLKFEDASKGFKEIQKESEKVDFQKMRKSMEPLKLEFSALEIAATTAIANITNKLTNEVTKWGKMLTIQMPQVGYSKYDQQIGAMQTLVNQTGMSIGQLEGKLEKLQQFSDETSYSFDEMMTALQTMVSSGGALDDGIELMMGLANATAYAGQNAQAFTHAARNLTQSYSMGYLTLMDWKSLELAKVNSKALIQTLIDTGEEMGRINKGQVTLANFRDTLSKQWADREVMEEAFGRFAAISNEALELINDETSGIETYDEALTALSKNYDGVYVKAARAAYEAKTFSEVVDYTKDALSTQWSTTFKFLIGNYEEAKNLWTGIADILYRAFVKPREETNAILKEWKELGGRTSLLKAFAAVLTNVMNITNAIKQGFREVFPRKTAAELAALTDKFAKFNEKLILSNKTLNYIKMGVSGVASIFKALGSVFKSLVNAIMPANMQFQSIGEAIGFVIAVVGTLLRRLAELISESDIISGIAFVISKAVKGLSVAVSLIVAGISALINAIKTSGFKVIATTSNTIRVVLEAIAGIIAAMVSGVKSLYKNVSNFFILLKRNGFFSKIGNAVLAVVSAIGEGIMIMVGGIKAAISAIALFIQKIKNMSWADKFKAIGDVFVKIKNSLSELFKKTKLGDLFGDNDKKGQKLAETFGEIKNKILEFTGPLTAAKLLAAALIVTLVGVASSLTKLLNGTTTLVTSAAGTLKTVRNIITKTYAKNVGILNVAYAIGILAVSLKLLSTVPTVQLASVAGILTTLLVVIGLFNKFNTTIVTNPKDMVVNKFVQALMAFSGIGVAMLAFAGALKIITTIPDEQIWDAISKLGMISVMVGGISLLLGWMSGWEKEVKGGKTKPTVNAIKFALLMATVSSSVLKLSQAVTSLAGVDSEQTVDIMLKVILPMFAAIGLLAAGLGQVRVGSFVGILGILATMKIMMPMINDILSEISKMPSSTVDVMMDNFADNIKGIIAVIVGLLTVLAIAGPRIDAGTKGLNRIILSTGVLIAEMVWILDMVNGLGNISASAKILTAGGLILVLGGIIGIILAVAKLQSSIRSDSSIANFSKLGTMFLKIGASLSLVMASVAMITSIVSNENVDFNEYAFDHVAKVMNKALIWMGIVFAGVTIAAGQATKDGGKASVNIIRNLTTSLLLLVGGIVALSLIDEKQLKAVLPVLAVVGATVAATTVALIFVMKSISNIFAYTTSVNQWAKGFKNLSTLIGTALLIFTITDSLIKLYNNAPDLKQLGMTAAILAATTGSILLCAGLINKFINDSVMRSSRGTAAKIALLSVSLVGTIGLVAHIGSSLTKVLSTGASTKDMIAAAGSITIVVAAITGAIAAIMALSKWLSNSRNAGAAMLTSLLSMAGMVGIILSLGYSLDKLRDLDWDAVGSNMLKISYALSLLTGVIGGIGLLAGLIGPMGLAGVAVVFGAVVRSILLIANGIAKVSDKLTTFINTFQNLSFGAFATVLQQSLTLGHDIVQNMNTGFQSATSEFNTIGDTMIEMLEQALPVDKFVVLGNYIGEGISEGIKQSLGDIKASAHGIGDTVTGTVAYDLKIHSPSLVMKILGGFAGAGFANGLFGSQNWAAEAATAISNATTDTLDNTKVEAAKEGAEAATSWWSSFWNKLKGGDPNNRYAAAEAALSKDDGLLKKAGTAVANSKAAQYLTEKGVTWDNFKKAGAKVIDVINNPQSLIDTMNEYVNLDDVMSGLTGTFDDITGAGGDANSMFEDMSDGLSDLGGSAESVKSTFETLRDAFEISNPFDDFDFTTEDPEKMIDNLSHQLLGLAEFSDDMAILAARGVNQNLLEYLGNQGPQAYKYVAGLADATDEQLEYMNNLWSQKLKLPSYAAEEVEASYKYAGEMAAQGFSNALDQYFAMIDARGYSDLTIDQLAAELEYYIPKTVPKAVSNGIGAAQPLIDEEAGNAGIEAADSMADSFEEQLQNRIYGMSGILTSAFLEHGMYGSNSVNDARIKKLYNAIWSGEGSVISHNMMVTTKRGKELQDVYSSWLEIGDMAFQGLNNSFINNKQDMINTIAEFIDYLPETARKKLEIGSPSRVMAEIGGYAIEGLKNGIASMAPDVNKEAEDITGGLVDTMSEFAKNVLTYLFGDTTSTMTITPVLDLSRVQNGAASINSMFASDQAIRATAVFDANKQAYAASASNAAVVDNLIRECSNKIIEAIAANQPIVDVNNYNEADPYGIFKACRTEVKKFTKANGYNPMIQTM